ncbi:MAG: phospho-N-acetylmuramoyl-pentapeptide-transferase [Chloroflexi bacterium]|nr:phospho-N-acetylmuramoyl-pentapeptide-transferase [Chloroflexota bacterium]MDA1240713.1 phospho-N-acetylmuramoyl-pentapeptide-transferase [Chloroflexota bacterium]MQC25632.1 phospho-N-acetylmuramoyl-pentapeptide-transferase [Chloroflexota bacterium]MQC47976.1 phospho-N-acetylmuramoyl-pentapeptide-transferase [Chloroflexota bacterium]
MIHALLTGGAAFALALLLGRPTVRLLHERKLGKAISEWAPSTHSVKSGTPTMGGLFIWGTVAIITLFTNIFELRDGVLVFERGSIALPLVVIVTTALIGIWDDMGTLVGGTYQGLSWRLKFGLIGTLSAAVAGTMFWVLDAQSINIPWAGQHQLSYVYLLVAFITVFSTTTAVAVTDGLDGLLGGLAAFAFAAYGVIAFMQGQEFLAVFCFTVVGALLGFLWYNAHPASVFMGDTGALPLGASLATVALMTGHWLLLPIIGVVFVAEAMSDVIQIAYFKTTGGRRLFRRAPLHNHLELLGWSEPQVVMRLYLFGIAGAMVGVALAISV